MSTHTFRIFPIVLSLLLTISLFQKACSYKNYFPIIGIPFAASKNLIAGHNPHYIGHGFLNGDDHLDIVSTDFDSSSITILFGDGKGNFTIAPGTPIPVGLIPVTAEVGDFNNDKKADIAISNQNSNDVSILLGDGDGLFTPAPGSPVLVGKAPRGLAVGNFNGDSNLDIVTTNGGSNDLSILLGNGDGTFSLSASSPLAAGSAPFHVVTGNFNADKYSDLAVANLVGGSISIFLGDGEGRFTQFGSEIPVGKFTSFIATGFFNADSKADLAVTNRLDNNVVILLGEGNGNFIQAKGSPYEVGLYPMGVAAGDLNQDGITDLAVSNEGSANATILLGDGSGGFGEIVSMNTGRMPTHISLLDFNADGKLDIVTPNGADDTITILLNICDSRPKITVNPKNIPSATAGQSFNQKFTATGGNAPYKFIVTGTLPDGLSFNDSMLQGTPAQPGMFSITVYAIDSKGRIESKDYKLIINSQTTMADAATFQHISRDTGSNSTLTQKDNSTIN